MTIWARYPGKCAKCGGPIQPGEQINWDKSTKRTEHVTCPEHAEVPQATKTYRLSRGSGDGYRGWQQGQIVRASDRQRRQGYPDEDCEIVSRAGAILADSLQARLTESRIGRKDGRRLLVPAGAVVHITGINPSGHMRAHYHGYGLSVSQDQATPIYDEEVSPMTQTTAERVAALLGDDGMRFETEDGREFAELLEAEHATEQHDWTRSATRYLFPDGSAIVEQGGAWDIEGSEPFSWAGAE